MKKALIFTAGIITAALSLYSCVAIRDVPELLPADTSISAPFVIDAAPPDISSVTEAIAAHETEADPPAARFSVSDIAENGRTLDLYGVEIGSALAELETALNDYSGNISFAAYDISGEKALSYNSAGVYYGHCTVKAGYMLYCCKEIERGAVSKDEVLTYHERHYDSGAGKIKKGPFGTSYTIENLIRLSLSVSDNAAYRMLVERFGKSGYNDFIAGIGAESLRLEDYTIWANRTKPLDLIKAWREIYNYFAEGSNMALMMKESCTGTPYSYITREMPGLEYSHKSGEYYGEYCGFHDAAIVWNEKPYLICAMSDSEGDDHTKMLYSMIINTVNDVLGE